MISFTAKIMDVEADKGSPAFNLILGFKIYTYSMTGNKINKLT